MENQRLNADMRELACQLKRYFWAEVRRLIKIRLGLYGKNVNANVGPLTSRLALTSTLKFFWVWRSFSPALEFMSPRLGERLDAMTEATEHLSGHMDCYDGGDRSADSHAAYLFVLKTREVRTMIEGMPA